MITATESGYGGMEAEISAEVMPGPGAAAEARRALEELGDLLSPGKLEDVRLLVSELVTNSLVHAGLSPDEAITVTVQGGLARGEVRDRGPGFEPPQEPVPKPDLAGGWGLYIVDRVADRWGVARTGSKSVWFEIDLDD
jgi:anti-sigma regulatory factor (Ser/Thr protein kinase)